MGKVLEVIDLTKIYDGGILANHNVNFSVDEGEIHALVGENGAGKSTLMKMLFGLESITSGKVLVNNKEVKFASSKDAIEHGIGMVHQHFMLVGSLSVADNLTLGVKGRGFFQDRIKAIKETKEIAEKYNFDIDADKLVRDISVGMKQKLEILKVLYRGAKIIILDEPTAVLTPQETEELFEKLIELKKQGLTIIFISHKLNEVKQLCDRVTILKNGKTRGTYLTKDVTEEEISRLMVGRDVVFEYNRKNMDSKKELLKIENMEYTDYFGVKKLDGVSLQVNDGEIVGIAGVEGNGQSELVEIIMGSMKPEGGKVIFHGKDITGENTGSIRDAGVSFIPEDRLYNGCAEEMSVGDNLIVSNISSFTNKLGIINNKKVKEHCKELIKKYLVKTKDENQTIKGLSGGNIQKAIVAREFSAPSELLIISQPTRGVDVGAIEFIHKKILEKREEGKGILLVSADLSELIGLSDRILVMHKGKVVANLNNAERVSEEDLGLYMLGVKTEEVSANEQ